MKNRQKVKSLIRKLAFDQLETSAPIRVRVSPVGKLPSPYPEHWVKPKTVYPEPEDYIDL